MRFLLPALVLVLAPGLASAECVCACVAGRPSAICQPPALVEPICQQICTPRIEQSLTGGGAGGGGLSSAAGGLGASGLSNPAALNALSGR